MQENDDINSEDLQLILQTSVEAAELALKYFKNDPQVWMKPGNSPVSEADLAVDKLIKERLLSARPHYGWISEETNDDRPSSNYQRSFVIDPIDGTRGFLSGDAYWCISLAVVEQGIPQVGVLNCPVNKVIYAAQKNNGATRNGQKLPVLDNDKTIQNVSATKLMEEKLPQDFSQQIKFAHYLPSLAYRIALTAEGKIDLVFVKPDSHDWDIAAADLILRECGGVLVNLDEEPITYGISPYSHGFLIASVNSQLKNVIDIVRSSKLV